MFSYSCKIGLGRRCAASCRLPRLPPEGTCRVGLHLSFRDATKRAYVDVRPDGYRHTPNLPISLQPPSDAALRRAVCSPPDNLSRGRMPARQEAVRQVLRAPSPATHRRRRSQPHRSPAIRAPRAAIAQAVSISAGVSAPGGFQARQWRCQRPVTPVDRRAQTSDRAAAGDRPVHNGRNPSHRGI
jgi:hypothetical protein